MSTAPLLLVVDDEPAALRTTINRLGDAYAARHAVRPTLLPAASADEAERLIAERRKAGRPVDVLVTDLDMPGRTGFDLAERVAAQMPVVAITGRSLASFRTQAGKVRWQPEVIDKPTNQEGWDALADRVRNAYMRAVVDATMAADDPARADRLVVNGRHGAVLAVRVDLGPVADLRELSGGRHEAYRQRHHANVFEAAMRAESGRPGVVFGQLLTAVFWDADEAAGLERACRVDAAYRRRVAAELRVPFPESASAVVPGVVQYGLIGELGAQRMAILGAVAEAAVQLLPHVARGKLGYSPNWLTPDELASLTRTLPSLGYHGVVEHPQPVRVVGMAHPVRLVEWDFA